ncbi:MAG: transposase, partial [candidate division NC10 bacterium]|nr:transposase [candidate division NC10 bacterium]
RITHAVMDLGQAFRNSFQAHCPGVQILYDKFHVIQHLLVALNEVRKQELKRAGQPMRGLLVGKKFILLSRKQHLKGPARQALKPLLGFNCRLFKAHLLKEIFGQLWSSPSKTWARTCFERWVEQLKGSRLAP